MKFCRSFFQMKNAQFMSCRIIIDFLQPRGFFKDGFGNRIIIFKYGFPKIPQKSPALTSADFRIGVFL